MKRIITIAVISGIISSIITVLLFLFVFPSGWLLFLPPAVMGTCIHKFGNISTTDVDRDEKLEKKVGYMCAASVLLFVLLTAVPILIVGLYQGMGWKLLWDVPFFIACGFAVFYGYNRGVRAVVDSYFDSYSKENNRQ